MRTEIVPDFVEDPPRRCFPLVVGVVLWGMGVKTGDDGLRCLGRHGREADTGRWLVEKAQHLL